jgi:hypothetical protein
MISSLYHNKLLNASQLEEGLLLLCEAISEFVVDVPFAYKYAGSLFATIVHEECVTLSSLLKIFIQTTKKGISIEKALIETFSKLFEFKVKTDTFTDKKEREKSNNQCSKSC